LVATILRLGLTPDSDDTRVYNNTPAEALSDKVDTNQQCTATGMCTCPGIFDVIATSNMTAITESTEAQRVFHGRGGMYRGCEHLALDWFHPVWVLTSFSTLEEDSIQSIQSALKDHCHRHGCCLNEHAEVSSIELDNTDANYSNVTLPPITADTFNFVYQCRSTGSSAASNTLREGAVPRQHTVTENGLKYEVRLLQGQNQGIFLDMANGRRWVQDNANNQIVLNLFAYTCAFSVAALAGGAYQVVNMDMAKGALKIGQRNHEMNHDAFCEAAASGDNGANDPYHSSQVKFFAHDIFKSWGKIKRLGPYDRILVDPPSFQKGSFVAKKDYGKVIRRLPSLLLPSTNSKAMLCLNAPELSVTFLQELVREEAPELEFAGQIENPLSFLSIDPDRALKVLLYQMKADCIDDEDYEHSSNNSE